MNKCRIVGCFLFGGEKVYKGLVGFGGPEEMARTQAFTQLVNFAQKYSDGGSFIYYSESQLSTLTEDQRNAVKRDWEHAEQQHASGVW
jgi:hypothetical protein